MAASDMKATDKRYIANKRVRDSITAALFDLMEDEPFYKITITQIASRAHVARQSFYRNFESKEAIVEEFFQSMYEDNLAHARGDNLMSFNEDMILLILRSLKEHKREILLLNENGFANRNLDMVTMFVIQVAGEVPTSSTDSYLIYYFAGALYNTLLEWLRRGARESCEQMAAAISRFQASSILSVDLEIE
ncbi:MAG: TetR/AcrR family transcriptional regulator [Eggerthellaceae bacterium]